MSPVAWLPRPWIPLDETPSFHISMEVRTPHPSFHGECVRRRCIFQDHQPRVMTGIVGFGQCVCNSPTVWWEGIWVFGSPHYLGFWKVVISHSKGK